MVWKDTEDVCATYMRTVDSKEPLCLHSLKEPSCLASATSYFFLLVILKDDGRAAPRAKLQIHRSLNSGLGKNFRVPSLIFAHAIRNTYDFPFPCLIYPFCVNAIIKCKKKA